MISASSVKDKLKNIAIKERKAYQELLIDYGLERTIYRLSISKYRDNFTLKGGIFLYGLFCGNYARSTLDIDLLGENISNEIDNLERIFKDIFNINVDDAMIYDLDTLKITNITEFDKYHGVNISVIGLLDKSRIPISLDIGFGDDIYLNKVKMEFPTLLDNLKPVIYAYSIYSVIAEKFEAIVSLGLGNSRFKDFYDIYVLSTKYNLEGYKLKQAFIETFENRNTVLRDIVAFDEKFLTDSLRIKRWNAFIKKKNALLIVSLEEAIKQIEKLLNPLRYSIENNTNFYYEWDCNMNIWRI